MTELAEIYNENLFKVCNVARSGEASKLGAPNTLMISGLLCILGSTLFAKKLPVLREIVHPI